LVLLVYLPPEVQIARLTGRDGFSREEAEARLAAQMPIDAKLPFADMMIRNDGSQDETRRATDAAWEELRRRERKKREGTG
jgi:dephospho-CoA kinase